MSIHSGIFVAVENDHCPFLLTLGQQMQKANGKKGSTSHAISKRKMLREVLLKVMTIVSGLQLHFEPKYGPKRAQKCQDEQCKKEHKLHSQQLHSETKAAITAGWISRTAQVFFFVSSRAPAYIICYFSFPDKSSSWAFQKCFFFISCKKDQLLSKYAFALLVTLKNCILAKKPFKKRSFLVIPLVHKLTQGLKKHLVKKSEKAELSNSAQQK